MSADCSLPQRNRQVAACTNRIDSTAGPSVKVNANGNPIKRRASRACQSCRARKVRCNVLERGMPCTNCRLDEVPCLVTKSKWRKYVRCKKPLLVVIITLTSAMLGYRDRRIHSATSQETIADNSHKPVHRIPNLEPSIASNHIDINRIPDLEASIASNHIDDTTPTFVMGVDSGLEVNSHDAGFVNQTEILGPVDNIQQENLLPSGSLDHDAFGHTLMNAASFCGDLVSNQGKSSPTLSTQIVLPAYIKSLPNLMTAGDIHHLWENGALSIPELILRDELLRCYIEYVYPYMPAIELHKFLEIIDQNNKEGKKVSLLLFQAIMFAGSAFVDIALLEAAGYTSRKAAWKAFYHKVKVLYDSDYEVDRIAIVQSLLLMTLWYENPDDQKDTWHWMGIAISVAQTVGIHRNKENSLMNIETQRLWRRIWWSCFIRDQLVALGLSRSTRIRDDDYDVPMLTLDDFCIGASSADNIGLLTGCDLIRDTLLQTDLALMCIAKVKLCQCISHVLSTRFCNLVRDQETTYQDDMRASFMLFPEKMSRAEQTQRCADMLMEWSESLSAPCLYVSPSAEEISRSGPSFFVQRALLHMLYFATVSAHYRLQVLPTPQKDNYVHASPQEKAQKASREIGRICLELLNLKLEGFLPTSSLTALLPACVLHLHNIKSSDYATRKEALHGFYHCVQVVEKLRDKYYSADYASRFLEAAIRKADLKIVLDDVLPGEGFAGLGGVSTSTHEVSGLSDASIFEGLAAQGFPSVITTPLKSSSYPCDNERGTPQAQNFGFMNGAFEIFGADINHSVHPFIETFAVGDDVNHELWENTLRGVMSCESGGLLADMDWL